MSSKKWKSFFIDAGLPADAADSYAILFGFEHRISFDMLSDLNREILADMGIKKMGDVISILRYAKEVSMNSQKRKLFSHDGDDEDDNPKRDFIKADSTISNDSARVIVDKSRSISTKRFVTDKQSVPVRRIVTGLDTMVVTNLKRKSIEPPGSVGSNKIQKVDMIKPESRSKRFEFDEKIRLNNFTRDVKKAVNASATSIDKKPITTSQSVSFERTPDSTTKLPIHARLGLQSTKDNNNNNTKKSIQDRLGSSGSKTVFDRLGTSSSKQWSIFDRLGR